MGGFPKNTSVTTYHPQNYATDRTSLPYQGYGVTTDATGEETLEYIASPASDNYSSSIELPYGLQLLDSISTDKLLDGVSFALWFLAGLSRGVPPPFSAFFGDSASNTVRARMTRAPSGAPNRERSSGYLLSGHITTAHDLGDAVSGTYLNDDRLSRKIIALAAYGIQISQGVLELMRDGAREREVLTSLLRSDELRSAGGGITQQGLENMLLVILRSSYPEETVGTETIPISQFSRLVRAMNLDLSLRVKVLESGMVLIATEDEIDAEKGMSLVLSRRQELARSDPSSFFESGSGQELIGEAVEEELKALAKKMVHLPLVADPDEFERTLRELSLAMSGEKNRSALITSATKNFMKRPVRSRRVIAEVLRDMGINPKLMDSIIFLSSERAASLQEDAIGMVVKSMTSDDEPMAIEMAVITVLRVLEDASAATSVRAKALDVFAVKAGLIQDKIPNFFTGAGMVQKVKTLLLEDPVAYRAQAQRVLLAFGRGDPSVVMNGLSEDLDVIIDPNVLLTYYSVLEELSTDWSERKDLAIKKWKLAFDNRLKHPELLTEVVNAFHYALPGSLDTLFNIQHAFDAGGQVFMAGLLDRTFLGAMERGRADVAEPIAIYFKNQLVDEELEGPFADAIIGSSTLISPQLADRYHEMVWSRIGPKFAELASDKAYVERFVASGRVMLPQIAELFVETTDPALKETLAQIVHRKFASLGRIDVSRDERGRDYSNVAIQMSLVANNLMNGSVSGVSSGTVVDMLKSLSASTLLDVATLNELASASFGALERGYLRPEEMLEVYAAFADDPSFDETTLGLCVRGFLSAVGRYSERMIEDIVGGRQDPIFIGLTRAITSDHMTGELSLKTFGEMQKIITGNPKLKFLAPAMYSAIAGSKGLRADLAEFLFRNFMQFLQRSIPEMPNIRGFVPNVPYVFRNSVSGIDNLMMGGHINQGQIDSYVKMLKGMIVARPEVSKPAGKNTPITPVPDPFKEYLKEMVSRYAPDIGF